MVTLESCELFRSLTPPERTALRGLAKEKSFHASAEIFKEGDPGDGVYLVKEGEIEIAAASSQSSRKVLSKFGPGEMFGEMAVLETKPRSATATAATDTVVYFVPRDSLLAMIGKSPAFALDLLKQISQRLREFDQRHVQEIIQAERLAVVGRFARGIIHDLKNPLNIIGLTAEMAAMDHASHESRRKAAATIRKQVERITDMVADILDFTQVERSDVILAELDYATFLQQVLQEIRVEVELRNSRLEVHEPIPSAKASLDPRRLRRVFVNLIHNATDAMPAGGTISVRVARKDSELITEIADTGPGIAQEIAGKLFQAFASFGKEHGTGLGLSICKKIVEDHRGRIWARNEPGRGAIFSFSLPVENQ